MSGAPPPQYAPQDSSYPPTQDNLKPQTHMAPPSMPQPQQPSSVQTPPIAMTPQASQPQNTMSAAEMGQNYQAQLFAMCAQGIHDPRTKYGMFFILFKVLLTDDPPPDRSMWDHHSDYVLPLRSHLLVL
ncbi:hypothetical protein D9757_007702 [Collybiopsis confluens]|uniref:Uncharacterized protein n=1 Tax=Collybiopsis confluens TaxID=2823264 RepID=A0A8H5H5P0_9AGAR|nr:hypothetical protein D9757_007702 [Collybiopsis confluens]